MRYRKWHDRHGLGSLVGPFDHSDGRRVSASVPEKRYYDDSSVPRSALWAADQNVYVRHFSGVDRFERSSVRPAYGREFMISVFDVPSIIGTTNKPINLAVVCSLLAIVGGCYAVFGGLKAVAVSDTVNGIGLVIGGLLIPILGLRSIGGGSMTSDSHRPVSEAMA